MSILMQVGTVMADSNWQVEVEYTETKSHKNEIRKGHLFPNVKVSAWIVA